jgi:DNA modification methylase
VSDTRWRIICGDALEVLRTLEPASVDAIVTDPPYGLGFMGKKWDRGVPDAEAWAAALGVAKPGAFLAAFGGTRTYHRMACAVEDAGWRVQDCLIWLHGQGFPKGRAQLKPAWEPIILARKPGRTLLNIDGCRIGVNGGTRGAGPGPSDGIFGDGLNGPRGEVIPGLGRWPANVCLDEEAAALLDEMSAPRMHAAGYPTDGKHCPSKGAFGAVPISPAGLASWRMGDSGGASRFFYTAKATTAERQGAADRRGTHPTVKPLALMRWLCRLVTPPGGLVLDPFCGSGTTIHAALAEGMQATGIEIDEETARFARLRVAGPLFAEATP